jgi:flagellin-like hook-associated protein FlgL
MPMPLSGLANTLSNTVQRIQSDIVDVQNQLASGTKKLDPAQNGVVTRLSAQTAAWAVAQNNIATAQNVITVAQSALTSIATIMTQMKALATQSSSAGLTSSDKTSLNTTFQNLS